MYRIRRNISLHIIEIKLHLLRINKSSKVSRGRTITLMNMNFMILLVFIL